MDQAELIAVLCIVEHFGETILCLGIGDLLMECLLILLL